MPNSLFRSRYTATSIAHRLRGDSRERLERRNRRQVAEVVLPVVVDEPIPGTATTARCDSWECETRDRGKGGLERPLRPVSSSNVMASRRGQTVGERRQRLARRVVPQLCADRVRGPATTYPRRGARAAAKSGQFPHRPHRRTTASSVTPAARRTVRTCANGDAPLSSRKRLVVVESWARGRRAVRRPPSHILRQVQTPSTSARAKPSASKRPSRRPSWQFAILPSAPPVLPLARLPTPLPCFGRPLLSIAKIPVADWNQLPARACQKRADGPRRLRDEMLKGLGRNRNRSAARASASNRLSGRCRLSNPCRIPTGVGAGAREVRTRNTLRELIE